MSEKQTPSPINKVVSLELIKAHPQNYNMHPESQIRQLGASYSELGQFRSVVLWEQSDGTYIQLAGHGVVEAMKREGASDVRADILPPSLDPMIAKRIMLADNLHAQNSQPDDELLAHLLDEQKNAGFDLASLGTDEEALRQLLQSLGDEYLGGEGSEEGDGGDDFDVDPDNIEVRCKRGDLWQLGEHRLLVDDATDPENVKRLMGGEQAVLMVTDPPYGDSWVQKARDMKALGYGHTEAGNYKDIENDDAPISDLKAFLISFLQAAKHAGSPPMPYYVWHGAKRIVFEQSLIEAGYFVHQPVVWVKSHFVFGRLNYHPRCEWALHGWRQGNGACPFYGERNQSDVWEVARENDKIHPTQKPLELFCIPLRNHTQPGEICYEPFAGSGTCLIAAEREGRRCYAMELDEKYASVILTRWEAETGEEATLLERVEEEVTHG